MNTETALQHADPEQQMALEQIQPMPQAVERSTPQERRVVEVTEALLPAYQRASTLEMTDEEIEKLTESFPDSAVEIRPHDGLIYIPHIFVRNRLNQVFKPGKWALIRRREWFDEGSNVIYGEYVLVVRGCYVGESIGGHPYIRNNPKTNYSDALESTAAEALRRICGKCLSCGDQVWQPDYARQWVEKHAIKRNGRWDRLETRTTSQTHSPPPSPVQSGSTASRPLQTPKKAKPEPKPDVSRFKERMIALLDPVRAEARQYFIEQRLILPTEDIDAISDTEVPTTKEAMDAMIAAIQARMDGEVQEAPTDEFEIQKSDEPWRSMVTPFKAGEIEKGTPFGELPKNKLWWWCTKWEPKAFQGQISAEDLELRQVLDEVREKYFSDGKE